MGVCPRNHGSEISLEVDNGLLTAGIVEVWMIPLMEDVEHDGAGTKVERDILADGGFWITGDWMLEAALFDGTHANEGAGDIMANAMGIGYKLCVLDDAGKVIDMGDVVDLGVGGNHAF